MKRILKKTTHILYLIAFSTSLYAQTTQNTATTPTFLSTTTNSSASTVQTTPNGSAPVASALFADASLGLPVYAGSGCPIGTMSAALSPDSSVLSIIFDQYIVEAGGFNFATGHKHCDVTIPIYVPFGFQVSIIRADYRGFNDLPVGGQSQFRVEYFLAGETTGAYTEVFDGPITDDFLLRDTVNTDEVWWSDCGQPVNFRINTDVSVFTNSSNHEASTTVDTADVSINSPGGSQGLQFYFDWQPCGDYSAASSVSPSTALVSLGLLSTLGMALKY